MTAPEPTRVFRCFPWLQLVFCLACLSMTGWTWMRYSYAWSIRTDDLVSPVCDGQYVVLDVREKGIRVLLTADYEGNVSTQLLKDGAQGPPVGFRILGVMVPGGMADAGGAETFMAIRLGPTLKGRLLAPTSWDYSPSLDVSASRFHGASIAGLVVGAMGCFIFGLYLRAWLRETRAAA